MLEVRSLEKSFGPKQVLFGIDFQARPGRILGSSLLGDSKRYGCQGDQGKTPSMDEEVGSEREAD